MKIRSFISQHFEKALQRGYIPLFEAAATRYDFPTSFLMALASRETNMTNMKGDFRGGIYHGFGIIQVDIGTAREWCESGKWQDVGEAIMKGTSILAGKRNELVKAHAHFKSDEDFMWVLAASYNHGAHGSLGDYILRGSPDLHTTGHDYGKDVIGRWHEFEHLMAARGIADHQPGAPAGVTLKSQPQGSSAHLMPAPAADSADDTPEPVETLETGQDGTQGAGSAENAPTGDSAQSTAPSVVVQKAENVQAAPQPVPGGGKDDPPVPVAAAVPAKSGALKSIIAAVTAPFIAVGIGLTDVLTAAKNATASNPMAFVVIVAVLAVLLLVYWKFQDRQTKLDLQREQHAHELDKMHLQIASDQTKINAVVTPPQN